MAARKRRAPGTGSITRRADGTYVARLVIRQRDGAPRIKYARARSEREARSKLVELKDKYLPDPAAAAAELPVPKDTVDALLPRWEDAIMSEAVDYGLIRTKTARDAVKLFKRHVLPRWTGRKVAELCSDDVIALNRELAEQYSLNTRRLVTVAVRRFLLFAEDRELLAKGTTKKVKVPKVKATEVRDVPDAGAVRALISAVLSDIDTHPAAVLVLVAATTGARRSEVSGMKFADIDAATATWYVQRSVVPSERTLVVDLPKTHASRRAVPLAPFVLDALQRVEQSRGGEWVGGTDRPAHPEMVAGYYRKIAKKHGLPTGMHALRRFVTTEVLAQTGDLAAASELLGHANLETTRKHYLAPVQSRVRRAAMGVVAEMVTGLSA